MFVVWKISKRAGFVAKRLGALQKVAMWQPLKARVPRLNKPRRVIKKHLLGALNFCHAQRV